MDTIEDPFAWLNKPLPKRHAPAPAATEEPSASAAPVESPFIPGTQIQFAWDSTSLGWFKRCPRLYQYKMIEGWAPKNQSIHLTFGILYHLGLQEYDDHRFAGDDHELAIKKSVLAVLRAPEWRELLDLDPLPHKNPDILLRSIIHYLDQFEQDPCVTWTRSDGTPATEVSFRFELDFTPTTRPEHSYSLCGHIDRVVDYNDECLVMDRKTTKYTLGKRFWDGFSPDNQVSLYTLAGQALFGSVLQGVIIDAAYLQVNSTTYGRAPIHRGRDQLDEWLVDLQYHLDFAERCAVQGYWPQNDTACDKFGGCEFRSICSMSPSQRDKFLPGKFKKEPTWNPLKPR